MSMNKKKIKLTVELIPRTSWKLNLRSLLPTPHWNALRRTCYTAANYKCEICGSKGDSHPVECHEVWRYYPKKRLQKLVALQALCPMCHRVKHIGLHSSFYKDELFRHLAKINNWDLTTTKRYLARVYKRHLKYSQISWKVDISLVEISNNTRKILDALNSKKKGGV